MKLLSFLNSVIKRLCRHEKENQWAVEHVHLCNTDDQYARQLSDSLQSALKTGRWSKSVLPEIFGLISFTNQVTISLECRRSLH
ncbi:MAG: hypothetical protein JSW40_04860, partial [Candidatus Omnitrophota bacterium]